MEIFPTILNLHLWSAERSAMASHLDEIYCILFEILFPC